MADIFGSMTTPVEPNDSFPVEAMIEKTGYDPREFKYMPGPEDIPVSRPDDGMTRRQVARMLAHQDYAEAKTQDTQAKAATDTSRPVVESILADVQTRSERKSKLQVLDQTLADLEQKLAGEVPQQEAGLPQLSNEQLLALAIGGMVAPGNQEAFIKQFYQTEDQKRQVLFENAVNQFKAKQQNVASQRKDVQGQIADESTGITHGRTLAVSAQNQEENRQLREQMRADAEVARIQTEYGNAKDVGEIERFGQQLISKGLKTKKQVEADTEFFTKQEKIAQAKRTMDGISRFESILAPLRAQYGGKVPDELEQQLTVQRQLIADALDIPDARVLGVIPTTLNLKGQEFAAKLPYMAETERVALVQKVTNVMRTREQMQNERQRLENDETRLRIAGFQADTSRFNALVSQDRAESKDLNKDIEKKIRAKQQDLAGEQAKLKTAAPRELQGINQKISEINGEIDFLKSQLVSDDTTPSALPGKRRPEPQNTDFGTRPYNPKYVTGTIGNAGHGTVPDKPKKKGKKREVAPGVFVDL